MCTGMTNFNQPDGWISVKDRLPDTDREVLIYDLNLGCFVLSCIGIEWAELPVIPAHGAVTIDTGVHIELPPNTAGFLKSKSGLNVKYGITSEGVIDVGYTGSIAVKLYNHSSIDYTVHRGDKISQLVVVKIDTPELALVEKLADTERGNGGFGSTGR